MARALRMSTRTRAWSSSDEEGDDDDEEQRQIAEAVRMSLENAGVRETAVPTDDDSAPPPLPARPLPPADESVYDLVGDAEMMAALPVTEPTFEPTGGGGWDDDAYAVAPGFDQLAAAAADAAEFASQVEPTPAPAPYDADHVAPSDGAADTHAEAPLPEPTFEPQRGPAEDQPYFVAHLISGSSATHNMIKVVSCNIDRNPERALALR